MFNVLEVLSKCVAILMVAAAFFAFVAFSPTIFCQGGGAGGNCGEGYLASLPLAMVLTPAVLIFATIYFFRSTKKILLSVLALLVIAESFPGIVGAVLGTAAQSYVKSHPTKDMQDYALRSYGTCLDMRARAQAQHSDDEPSAIERVSLDKCARERAALFTESQIDAGAVTNVEHEFQVNLPQLMETQRQKYPQKRRHRG
jgi:hypothetical protein